MTPKCELCSPYWPLSRTQRFEAECVKCMIRSCFVLANPMGNGDGELGNRGVGNYLSTVGRDTLVCVCNRHGKIYENIPLPGLASKSIMDDPLKNGCDDHWTWNRHDRSHEVRLFHKSQKVAHFHPDWSAGTAAVRGTRILNNGRLPRRIFGTSMMFGVATRAARLHADAFVNIVGEDENGWGLSHKGMIFHRGQMAYYTEPFRENEPTIVGILFDGISGTLTYYKDGVCLGVAFKDLHKVQANLYPIVASTAVKTEMTLISLRRDFVNLQDRCRAVIVTHLNFNDFTDLLPPKMKRYLEEGIHTNSDPPAPEPFYIYHY